MKKIYIRFSKTGKLFTFKYPEDSNLEVSDYVVAENSQGLALGQVVKIVNLEDDEELQEILRVATEEDIDNNKKNEELSIQTLSKCKEIVKKHNLDMKLIKAEYTLDKTKLTVYFVSEDRVDFRELVKELAGNFKVRIELRQVGVRDELKNCPTIGICGKEVCCRTFLPDLEPVTIKMAKEQGLQINMQKLTGSCGRLKCCLKFEQEVYEEKQKKLPKVGTKVITPSGKGKITSCEILKEKVRVKIEEDDGYHFEIFNADEVSQIEK